MKLKEEREEIMDTIMKNSKPTFAIGLLGLMLLTSCAERVNLFTKNLKSDTFVQLYSNSQIDLLWVLDNSASMTDRRAYVASNMASFISLLTSRKALDYQMAVTTTDHFTTAGNLIQNPQGLRVVKYGVSTNPASDVASIINNIQDSATSFWEQGLESSYKALENHGAEFSRNGATLYIVYLSDEEDYSCNYLTGAQHCQGIQPENNPNYEAFPVSRYYNYLSTYKLNQGAEVNVFPIIGLNSSVCTVASLGNRYLELQTLLGGIGTSGSICLEQLPSAFNNIARTISDRGVKFTLSSPNAVANGMTVYVNRVQVPYSLTNGWMYDAQQAAVYFTGNSIPALGAIIEVVYAK